MTMQDFVMMYYDGIKALHIIAVIAWMAGLLYLPRLFVYHAEHANSPEISNVLKIMERRLLKMIMNPASLAVWGFGGLMVYANPDLMTHGWMHMKLTAVILMTGLHHGLARMVKTFAKDQNTKSSKFFRILNEVPTVLLILIVFMVVLKPF